MDPMHIFYSIQNDMNVKMGFDSVSCFNDASTNAPVDPSFEEECIRLGVDDDTKQKMKKMFSILHQIRIQDLDGTIRQDDFGKEMRDSNTPSTGITKRINPRNDIFDGLDPLGDKEKIEQEEELSESDIRMGLEDQGVIPSEDDMDVTTNFTSRRMKEQNFKVDNLLASVREVMRYPRPTKNYLDLIHLTRSEYNELNNLVKYALSSKANCGINLSVMDAMTLIKSLNGLGFDASRDTNNWKDAVEHLDGIRSIDGSDVRQRLDVFKKIVGRLSLCDAVKRWARCNDKRSLPCTSIKDANIYSNTIPVDDYEFMERCRSLCQDVATTSW